jgi:glutathione S-transferase
MKLYSSGNSPFGARVTIAARAKGIELERPALPAGGLKGPEFLAINPIAKIPVLVLETAQVIVESDAILHYLEDRFPKPSLLPRDPAERARIDVAVRVMDTYVMASVIRTFPHLDPAKRDARVVDDEVRRWKDGLAVVAGYLAEPLPRAEADVSLADCALPTALHLSTRIAAMLGLEEDPMKAHPVLVDYYQRMKAQPIVGAVLRDLTEYQSQTDVKAGRPSLADRH